MKLPLFGVIDDIGVVRLPGHSTDQLLLVFSKAKLSIVEFDPVTNDLKTLSLNNWEDELKVLFSVFFLRLKWLLLQEEFTTSIPLIRVDPKGRCAAVLVNNSQIIILPFRKQENSLSAIDDLDAMFGEKCDFSYLQFSLRGVF